MILSRAKPAIQAPKDGDTGPGSATKKQLPKLEDFLSKRDYIGAMCLLEFMRNSGQSDDLTDLWIGCKYYHIIHQKIFNFTL